MNARVTRRAAKMPLLWAFRELTTRPPEFLLATRQRYGDVAYVRFGRIPLYVFHHPDDIEALLVSRAKDLVKDSVTRDLAVVLGWGSLTSDGAAWKRKRRIAAPSLQRRHVAAYAEAMVRHSRAYAERLVDGSWRDLHHDMMGVTLEIVGETLFAADVGGEVARVGAAMEEVMAFWDRELNSWRRTIPMQVPLPSRRAVRKPMAEVDAVISGIVRARRAALARGEAAGDDLISRWLVASRDDEAPFSDQELRDEAVTFFAAGHETTAIAVTAALYFLSLHGEVEAALHEEWERVLGARDAGVDDLPALRMTEAVCKETLRLHPPAWIVGREPTADLVFQGVEVPKGAQLLTSAFAVHRDARWFPDPERFWPERWLDASHDLPRFAYFPFGGGPRVCIGNHFAMMEMILMLATIGRRARFELRAGYRLERLAAITMRPRYGMPMRVHRRGARR